MRRRPFGQPSMPEPPPGQQARTAVALSFAARYASMLLRTLNLLILARLLAPEAFGTYATASALVALVFAITEGGLHNYLIQRPRFRRADIAACLGLATALAALGASLLVGLATLSPAGWLPAEATPLLLVLSITVLLPPIALPVSAKLQRQLRFGVQLWIDVGRTVASVGVSLLLAASGAGAMALAAGAVADAVVGLVMTLWLGAGRTIVWPRLRGWRPILAFAAPFAAVGALGRTGDAGVTLLLGQAQGLAAVGLYNRALVIHEIADRAFTQALTPILLPVLSQAQRRGRALGDLYLRKITGLTVVLWPFYAVLAILAEPIVAIMLGRGWEPAADVVRALSVVGLALPFIDLSFKFFIALGGNRAYALIQAGAVVLRLAAVGALATVSLPVAVLGIALALAVRALAITVWIKRRLGIGWRPIADRCAAAAVVTGASVIGPLGVVLAAGGTPGPAAGLLGVLLGASGWVLALGMMRHELTVELRALGLLARDRLGSRFAGRLAGSRSWTRR